MTSKDLPYMPGKIRKEKGGGGEAWPEHPVTSGACLIGTELLLPKLGPKKTAEPKKSLNCIDIDTLRLLPFCCPPCRANTRPCKLWFCLPKLPALATLGVWLLCAPTAAVVNNTGFNSRTSHRRSAFHSCPPGRSFAPLNPSALCPSCSKPT